MQYRFRQPDSGTSSQFPRSEEELSKFFLICIPQPPRWGFLATSRDFFSPPRQSISISSLPSPFYSRFSPRPPLSTDRLSIARTSSGSQPSFDAIDSIVQLRSSDSPLKKSDDRSVYEPGSSEFGSGKEIRLPGEPTEDVSREPVRSERGLCPFRPSFSV